jgi:nucleoside-diphosphate-sugar epimerase/glycosyltransferase involved in cell wall biosynthesis
MLSPPGSRRRRSRTSIDSPPSPRPRRPSLRIGFHSPRTHYLEPGISRDRILVPRLVDGLRALGHEVEVASRVDTYDFWRGRVTAQELAAEALAVRERMERFDPDGWLVYGATTTYPDLFGWWLRPRRYVHFNTSVDDGSRLEHSWRRLFAAAHRESLARADAVVAVRWKTADLLRTAGVPEAKLRILPPAVETWGEPPPAEDARRRFALPEDAPIALCAGRFTEPRRGGKPWKTEWLLELVDLVAEADLPDEALLVIAGDGPGRSRIEARIAELAAGGRVRLIGLVPHEEMPWLYAACDFFAYVATSDRIWHSGLEAQACARPLLTLWSPTTELVVEDGRTGLLARDREEFKRRLAQLAIDRDWCRQLGEAARADVLAHHSLDVRVRQIEQLLAGASANGEPVAAVRRPRAARRQRVPKRVLITGGLGFIGSFVSESVARGGAEVTIVDSGVSSVCEASELEAQAGSIKYVAASVEEYLSSHPSLVGFDQVIHCASYVGPAALLGYSGRIGPAIIGATAALIESCIRADIPLVNFSSAEVYGRSGMLFEGSDVRVPPHYSARIEYALGKLTAEAMCVNGKERGLRSVVLRPFNVAGPRQSRFGGFVLPTFVQQALAGRPLTVFATGRQKRAFCAVGDLCRFITDYLDDAAFDNPRIYNVGNPANTIEIYDLAVRVKEMVGSSSEIVFADARSIYGQGYEEAESFEKLPDIRTARELGWTPEVSLDELIEETIGYYRTHEDVRAAPVPLPGTRPADMAAPAAIGAPPSSGFDAAS